MAQVGLTIAVCSSEISDPTQLLLIRNAKARKVNLEARTARRSLAGAPGEVT